MIRNFSFTDTDFFACNDIVSSPSLRNRRNSCSNIWRFSHQDSGKILNNFRIVKNLYTSYPEDTGIDSLESQGFLPS